MDVNCWHGGKLLVSLLFPAYDMPELPCSVTVVQGRYEKLGLLGPTLILQTPGPMFTNHLKVMIGIKLNYSNCYI